MKHLPQTFTTTAQANNSWLVHCNVTGQLIAWITTLQNKLGNSNGQYQIVTRGEMSREFDVCGGYDSLNEVMVALSHYKIGGSES